MAGKTIAYLNVLIGADNRRLNAALDSSEKALKRFGTNLSSIGSDLSLKVTAPLLAIGAISTSTASKFSDSILKVKALSGATGAEFEALGDKAQELGATTRYSANEVADAMGYMALAGFNTNQTLAATPAILSLAAASATDLASASDIVTDTMSAFKLKATEAVTVADLFAKTQAKANTNVLQLGEAFKYVAPNFASANQSITDTSALLAVLANSGFKGSIAGTALNAMLKDLTTKSKDGAIQIGKTAVAIYDSSGAMRSVVDIMGDLEDATKSMNQQQKDAALGALFEERAIKAVNIMLNTGTQALRDYQSSLGDSKGAASAMADEMESGLGGSLRRMKSSLEGIQIVIGDNLAPTIDSLSNVIQGVGQWFTSLDKSTQKNIVTAGLFAASIPPVLFVLGKMITMGVGLVGKMKALATMFGITRAAALSFASSVGAVALPITAAVAALYAFYKAGEYFNKSAEVNKRVLAEVAVNTKNLTFLKNEAATATNELNTKTKNFNKLSEAEKKAILATTSARILDLEATLKQDKALAQLTARKAMELTAWEAFTASIFSFGQSALLANNLAKKSAEKYSEAMDSQQEAITGAEAELQVLKDTLNQIQSVTDLPVVDDFEALADKGEKLTGIISKLKQDLKRIAITKDVDKEFSNVEARVSTLRQALIDLRVAGISPISEAYKDVEAQYLKAFDSRALNELQSKLSELVGRDYSIKINQVATSVGGGLNNEPLIKSINDKTKAIFESNIATANAQKAGNDLLLKQQTDFNNQFNGLVSGFAADSIAGFAEGFGALLVNGKSGIEAFASSILGSMGKFLGQMGKMIVAYGVSMEAFKKAFTNPYAAIAAGAALVAIGGAITAMANKSSSKIGSGTYSASKSSGGSYNPSFLNSRGIGATNSKESVELVIKGDSLVGLLEKNSRFKSRLG